MDCLSWNRLKLNPVSKDKATETQKRKNTLSMSFKDLECQNWDIKFWPKSNVFSVIPDSLQDLICFRTNLITLKSWKFLGAFSKTQGSEPTTSFVGGAFFKVGKLKSFPCKNFYPVWVGTESFGFSHHCLCSLVLSNKQQEGRLISFI